MLSFPGIRTRCHQLILRRSRVTVPRNDASRPWIRRHPSSASCCFSSSSTKHGDSFLLSPKQTSGRRYKRLQRKRQRLRKLRQAKEGRELAVVPASTTDWDEEEEEEEEDKRTWRTILFPFTLRHPYDPPPDRSHWPKTPMGWWEVNKKAWAIYKSTWVGFFDNHKDDKDKELKKDDDNGELKANLEQVKENFQKNVEVTREESAKLLQEAKDKTGIHNLDDVKAIAREMMTVATEMLTEFMKEYRKGRDEEVDKMLNEYFQEQEDEEKKTEEEEGKKRRRRKTKRRIPCLLHTGSG